jgi:Helix-turn-helix domain
MSDRALTPRQVAERYGVGVHKILSMIDAGIIVAIDMRSPGSSRPRWRITAEAIADFERRRVAQPKAAPTPRRRRASPSGIIEFF